MRDMRSRLERLEQESQWREQDRVDIPSVQEILQAIHTSPQGDQFCELARRLALPDTPELQAEGIRQTLNEWGGEVITRLTDGASIDDCRLDTCGLPPGWFAQPALVRMVGGSTAQVVSRESAQA